MPQARKRTKKKDGQRAGAGRFTLSSESVCRYVLGRLLARAALVVMVAVLASSSISDSLQKFSKEGMADAQRIAAQDFTSWRQLQRLALLRRIAGDADAVRHLSADQLALVFGKPSLQREEPEAVSWHFTSAECALDVYFPRTESNLRGPVYAEYRVRSKMEDAGLVDNAARPLDHRACVRSLFAHARFSADISS